MILTLIILCYTLGMANKRQALQTIPRQSAAFAAARELVLNAVSSPRTRAIYGHALDEFERWLIASGTGYAISRQAVQAYRRYLETEGGEMPGRRVTGEAETRYTGKPMKAGAVNGRLSAIRKFARTLADLADDPQAARMADSVARVESVKRRGQTVGRWLTEEEVDTLVNTPDTRTLKGMRDRAALALMGGAGLREAEIVNLEVRQIERRGDRWMLANLTGKGNKTRTVLLSAWVFATLDTWMKRAGITNGRVLRTVTRKGMLSAAPGMSASSVWRLVLEHAAKCGYTIAPHDLRRTFARTALENGAAVDQIRQALGHESIATTTRYVGNSLDYKNPPADFVNVRLRHRQVEAEAVPA